MRYVFVIEDDPHYTGDIVDAITSIDPKIQIRLYNSLEEFFVWIKDMMVNGSASIAGAGKAPANAVPGPVPSETDPAQLVAVISKIEFLGAKQIPLLVKTRNVFIQKGICTAEDPTAFVLTAFEEPGFKVKDLTNRVLHNVILKPFDRLILAQDLTFAIDGRHPPSKYTIANQKTKASVEMLKDVQLMAVSEVGFVTKSERKIDPNAVAKYYGELFKTELKASVVGTAIECQPLGNEFICALHYFGLNPSQIASIRRKAKSKPSDYAFDWTKIFAQPERAKRPVGIVVVDENPGNITELVDTLQRRAEVQIATYKSYVEFCEDLNPALLTGEDGTAVPNENAFPAESNVAFVFDQAGTHITDLTKATSDEKPEITTLFGVTETDLRKHNWWSSNLNTENMQAWKHWLQVGGEAHFVMVVNGKRFYFKPVTRQKDPTKHTHKVVFTNLTEAEIHAYRVQRSKLPQHADFVLISQRFMSSKQIGKWDMVAKELGTRSGVPNFKSRLMVMASKDFSDEEMREYSQFATDIIYRPIDRNYFLQKLKLFVPELQSKKEAIEFNTIASSSEIHIASAVSISELSEAGLVMQYHRALPLGEFREFILWQAYELAASKIVGTCNFIEESSSEKGVFNNHFVFFAINDLFLKSIRVWIRENYIQSKEQK